MPSFGLLWDLQTDSHKRVTFHWELLKDDDPGGDPDSGSAIPIESPHGASEERLPHDWRTDDWLDPVYSDDETEPDLILKYVVGQITEVRVPVTLVLTLVTSFNN